MSQEFSRLQGQPPRSDSSFSFIFGPFSISFLSQTSTKKKNENFAEYQVATFFFEHPDESKRSQWRNARPEIVPPSDPQNGRHSSSELHGRTLQNTSLVICQFKTVNRSCVVDQVNEKETKWLAFASLIVGNRTISSPRKRRLVHPWRSHERDRDTNNSRKLHPLKSFISGCPAPYATSASLSISTRNHGQWLAKRKTAFSGRANANTSSWSSWEKAMGVRRGHSKRNIVGSILLLIS